MAVCAGPWVALLGYGAMGTSMSLTMAQGHTVLLPRTAEGAQAARPGPAAQGPAAGRGGQLGQELVPYLRAASGGAASVVASDIRAPPHRGDGPAAHGGAGGAGGAVHEGPFVRLDVRSRTALSQTVRRLRPSRIIHLASILSAAGELRPDAALELNTLGTINVLRLASRLQAEGSPVQVFIPSSIAVFGPTSGRDAVPDSVPLEPTTIYGVTKVHTELLCAYYNRRYGVDARCLRYPGVLSARAPPGGGTTDWACHILEAAGSGLPQAECFVGPNTCLPFVGIGDLLRGTELFLSAPGPLPRASYNMASFAASPSELEAEVRRHVPGFRVQYRMDEMKQAIADSWPRTVSDLAARTDWGWDPKMGLIDTVASMLSEFRARDRAVGGALGGAWKGPDRSDTDSDAGVVPGLGLGTDGGSGSGS